MNSNFSHLDKGPTQSPSKKDTEPHTIPQDSRMNVGINEGLKPMTIPFSDGISVRSKIDKESIRKSKQSSYTVLSFNSRKPGSRQNGIQKCEIKEEERDDDS